jgi:hypothetical protein
MNNPNGFAPILILFTVVALGVIGYLCCTYFEQFYILDQSVGVEDQIISPPTSSSSASPATTTWKTYKNEKFEFKYPEDWIYDGDTNFNSNFTLGITPKLLKESDESLSRVINIRVAEYKNINDHLDNLFCFNPVNNKCNYSHDSKETTLGGIKAKELKLFGSRPFKRVVAFKNGLTYEINVDLSEGYQNMFPELTVLKNEKIYDQIVSTFKFIEDISSGQEKTIEKVSSDWKNIQSTLPFKPVLGASEWFIDYFQFIGNNYFIVAYEDGHVTHATIFNEENGKFTHIKSYENYPFNMNQMKEILNSYGDKDFPDSYEVKEIDGVRKFVKAEIFE